MAVERLELGEPPAFNRAVFEKEGMVYVARLLDRLCKYNRRAFSQIMEQDDRRSAADTAAEYTITNDATDRAYDADATSTAELADVLATLIHDLENKELIP